MNIYLTPGCFDKGGISRYSRYQATALRELCGADRVAVYSVLGHGPRDIEIPFEVRWFAGGTSARHKAAFVARVLADSVRDRPTAVFCAHVNLAALAVALARMFGVRAAINVYGLEVWSGLRRDAAWGLREADLVISDCHATAQYINDHGLRPRTSPIDVLWDCVDTTRFAPGEPPSSVLDRYGIPDPHAHVNVMTLGRMSADSAYKGYARLLDAFSRIAAGFPQLRLIYAGGGELADELRRKASALGVADRVVFAGIVHEEDLPHVYRAASVFSLVSDAGRGRGEGIPLTPLEAASCGAPIIVGDQDGSREAVEEGVNGFIVPPFDLQAHAERLARLAANSELRRAMSLAARRRILAHHDYTGFRARTDAQLKRLRTPRTAPAQEVR